MLLEETLGFSCSCHGDGEWGTRPPPALAEAWACPRGRAGVLPPIPPPLPLTLPPSGPPLPLQKPGSAPEDVLVSCGVIDILQYYNLRKLIERGFKTLTHDGNAISVAPPNKYAQVSEGGCCSGVVARVSEGGCCSGVGAGRGPVKWSLLFAQVN